jgi:hypothetical protein
MDRTFNINLIGVPPTSDYNTRFIDTFQETEYLYL